MQEEVGTIASTLNALMGGAMATIVAGMSGRLMFHVMEVKKNARKFFGRELLWEIPTAVGMAMIAESLLVYVGTPDSVKTGAIAAIAYLGPRIIEDLFTKYTGKKE